MWTSNLDDHAVLEVLERHSRQPKEQTGRVALRVVFAAKAFLIGNPVAVGISTIARQIGAFEPRNRGVVTEPTAFQAVSCNKISAF